MKRKEFIQKTMMASASILITRDLMAKPKGPIYGHHEKRYRYNETWGRLNPDKTPVNDCHEWYKIAREESC